MITVGKYQRTQSAVTVQFDIGDLVAIPWDDHMFLSA